MNVIELWRDYYAISIEGERPYLGLNPIDMIWDKSKSQALYSWKTKVLRFKSAWKIYSSKQNELPTFT